MDQYVRTRHPGFYPTFAAFERQIMRVDAFRYVLMQDIGGLYCDLDYEFVRPFDYGEAEVVLSLEYDEAYGDHANQIANYLIASVPGHSLWTDTLSSLRERPPRNVRSEDVCMATGPGFLTDVFYANRHRYTGVVVTPKPVFSPRRVHGRYERKIYVNSGVTYGFHRGWGSWRERVSWNYLAQKLAKWGRQLTFTRDYARETAALWRDAAARQRQAKSRIAGHRD